MSTRQILVSCSARALLALLTAALPAVVACSDPTVVAFDGSSSDAGPAIDAPLDGAIEGIDAAPACPLGYVRSDEGVDCLFDGGLNGLAASVGVLSPEFGPEVLAYALDVPLTEGAVSLTPSVLAPAGATIIVDGADAISGEPVLVAALELGAPRPVEIVVRAESGRITRYTVVITRLAQDAYVKASNRSQYFGGAIAISSDGSTLAVGADGDHSASSGIDGDQSQSTFAMDSGAVYVFRRGTDGWAQEAFVKASNAGMGDRFGCSVALSSDGSTMVVGARVERSDATEVGGDQANDRAVASGAAYVFQRVGSGWSQQAYLKASNAETGDHFGWSVAISGDGTGIVVGAPDEDASAAANPADNSATDAGAAYGFRFVGSSWTQTAYLKASNAERSDRFGGTLAISEDGSTLAVGAAGESSAATLVGGDQASNAVEASGAVYVFARSAGSWSQEAYVKAPNPARSDFLGGALALSADGALLAVGLEREDGAGRGVDAPMDDASLNSGAVFLYARSGGAWTWAAYVKASNNDAGDSFGCSVALAADGTWLLVGATNEGSAATGLGGDESDDSVVHAGAGYLFRQTDGVWEQAIYLKASNPGENDHLATVVAISGDGSTLVLGAPTEASSALGVGGDENDDDGLYRGAVYVFR